MKQLFFMSCAIIFYCGNASALMFPELIDWEIGGSFSTYGYMEASETNDAEDHVLSDTRVLFANDISWQEKNIFVTADVEWRYETFYGGLEDESQSGIRFRDFYGEIRRDSYNLAIGQKRVTWGKLDDLVVIDRVVPQDFSHFVLYDKEERKNPVLMLQHQWFLDDDFQAETVFMPFFEPSELDFFGTNWAVFGHLKQVVAESASYTNAQKASVAGIAIQEDEEVTARSLKNSQVAFRVRGRKEEIDYSVYYMNLYHSIPVLKETTSLGNTAKRFLYEPTSANLDALAASGASGSDLLLTETYPRINTIGVDWETVVGEFGVRGEVALFFGMPFLAQDFAYTEREQASFGFGIDHTTDSQWYIDVQYLQDYIFHYSGLYGVDEAPSQFAGTISKELMRGKVSTDLDWVWNVSYGDWMLNPEITYSWEDVGLTASLGGFIFQDGQSSSLFGRYDKNDVIYIKINGKF